MYSRYTVEQFRDAVARSRSYAEVLSRLGLKAGGNYSTIRKRVTELGLDVSHMTGQSWARGTKRPARARIPLSDILVEHSTYSSSMLRQRLVRESIMAPVCSRCGSAEWMGTAIPLELDHINGNKYDNRRDNLRLLCPNCHAQTEHYRGRNVGRYAGVVEEAYTVTLKVTAPQGAAGSNPASGTLNSVARTPTYQQPSPRFCPWCGSPVARRRSFCSSECANKHNRGGAHPPKIAWPDADAVAGMVRDAGYSATARRLGVSDTAVRKFLLRYGPPALPSATAPAPAEPA